MNLFRYFAVLGCMLLLPSCSFVEMTGTMTRKTGEVMTDYSKKNDGFLGTVTGLGGKINTSVGGAVEDAAKEGAAADSGQPADANATASANPNSGSLACDATPELISKAQKRLAECGYDPGPADGVMGRKTRTAIAKYQQANNLQVTQNLDDPTVNALGIR